VVSVPSTSESLDRQGPYDSGERGMCSSMDLLGIDSSGLLPIEDFPMNGLEIPAVGEVDDEMDGSLSKKVVSDSLDHEDVDMAEVDTSLDDPKKVVPNESTLEKVVNSSEDHEDEYTPAADKDDDPPTDDGAEDPPADDEEEDLPAIVVKSKKRLDSSGESEADSSDSSSDNGSKPLIGEPVNESNVLKKKNQTSTDSSSDSDSGTPDIPPELRRSSRHAALKNKLRPPLVPPTTSASRKRKPAMKKNHILMKASFK
jgi:hypothetical protein